LLISYLRDMRMKDILKERFMKRSVIMQLQKKNSMTIIPFHSQLLVHLPVREDKVFLRRKRTIFQETFITTLIGDIRPLADGTRIKRNSRVQSTHMPIVILTHDWKIDENSKLTSSVYGTFGTSGQTALNWNDDKDPRPDYYKYLPSYYAATGDTINEAILYNNWQSVDQDKSIGISSILQTVKKYFHGKKCEWCGRKRCRRFALEIHCRKSDEQSNLWWFGFSLYIVTWIN
jgi:hypothetical protein